MIGKYSEEMPNGESANGRHVAFSRLAALVGLILLAGGLLVLRGRHPSEIGFLPACPSRQWLEVHCAGCGSTRAVHFLLNGRFGEAWRHNPLLMLLGLPAAGLYVAHAVRVLAVGRGLRLPKINAALGWAILAGILLFTVARNLPGAAFEWLRPP
jgi:hypothetical protein